MAETVTLPQDVQEKLARLEKLEKDNASLGYKVRQWERLKGDLGDVVEYDGQGNPMRLNLDDSGGQHPPVAMTGGHPLSGLTGLVDGFNPQALDGYVQQLIQAHIQKAGYITQKKAEELAQAAYQAAKGDQLVLRKIDRLTGQDSYKDLGNYDSPLSKQMAKVLQERGYGQPQDGARGFDQWRYRTLEDIDTAAELAHARYQAEQAKTAASMQQAQSAQAAASLSVPAGSQGGAASISRPEGVKTKADGSVDYAAMTQETQSNMESLGMVRR